MEPFEPLLERIALLFECFELVLLLEILLGRFEQLLLERFVLLLGGFEPLLGLLRYQSEPGG